ncbi:MAG: ABC transporter permease [Vicingaceae bacterium]
MKSRILLAFIKKEFLHIFRDYQTLVVLFGMPIIQVILFGYAITTDLRDVKIGIQNLSGDPSSVRMVNDLTSSDFFMIESRITSSSQMEEAFRKGKIKAFVTIPANFNSDLKRGAAKVQITSDASDPNTANIVTNQLSGIIQSWSTAESRFGSFPKPLETEVRMLYNPGMKSVYLFVPGVITIILMLVSAMLTSIAIAREKELGYMEILLVSPLNPATIIIGKIIPYLLLSLVNAAIILGLGNVVFGVPVNGSMWLLFFESLLFVSVALGLGVFISTKVESQQMALMLSLFALMMIMKYLGGMI